jgi:hypothetical protein
VRREIGEGEKEKLGHGFLKVVYSIGAWLSRSRTTTAIGV